MTHIKIILLLFHWITQISSNNTWFLCIFYFFCFIFKNRIHHFLFFFLWNSDKYCDVNQHEHNVYKLPYSCYVIDMMNTTCECVVVKVLFIISITIKNKNRIWEWNEIITKTTATWVNCNIFFIFVYYFCVESWMRSEESKIINERNKRSKNLKSVTGFGSSLININSLNWTNQTH